MTFAFGWALWTLLSVPPASALGGRSAENDPPVWRRIYVPADRVAELGERYPDLQSIERAQFEELLRRASLADQPRSQFLESARYEAVLEGDHLRGTAQLDVRPVPEADQWLRWPIGAWAITLARWGNEDARLGYAGHGEFGLIIPRGTTQSLKMNWLARGRHTEGGRQFVLNVPPSLRAELVLDLPRGSLPIVTSGSRHGPVDASNPSFKRWVIRQSPARTISFVVSTESGPQPFPAVIVYQRDMEVEVSEEATDLVAHFHVTVHHQATRQLAFDFSPDVEVYGWPAVNIHDIQIRDGRMQLDFAEPLLGTAQFTLRALGPGPKNGSWQLPSLGIPEAICQGGTVRVRSVSGLTLTNVESSAAGVDVQSSPDGRLEVLVQQTTPRDTLSSRVLRDRSQVTARVQTVVESGPRLQAFASVTWNVLAGETSHQQLRVPLGWSVQSVDLAEGGPLARWSTRLDAAGHETLTIHVQRPLTANVPFVAQVRLTGPDLDLSDSTVVPLPRLHPLTAHAADETISIEVAPPWSADVFEKRRISVLPPEGTGAGAPHTPVLRFDGPDAAGSIAITRRPADWIANFDVQVRATGTAVSVQYQIELESPGRQSDTVDLRWSGLIGDTLRWELPDDCTANRWQEENERRDGELWRIRLPHMAPRRTRLVAHWQTPLTGEVNVPLPILRGAATSTGRVSFRYPAGMAAQLQTEGLIAVLEPDRPRSAILADSRQNIWRYRGTTPRLSVRIGPDPRVLDEQAWAAQVRVLTRFDDQGSAVHRMWYTMRGTTGKVFVIQLPPQAKLRDIASSNGLVTETSAQELQVRGSASPDPWEFSFEYSTPRGELSVLDQLTLRLPVVPFPVARLSWEVEPVASYSPIHWSAELTRVPPYPGRNWAQVLFGPMHRAGGSGLFRFWQPSAWRAWWNDEIPGGDDFESRLQMSLQEFFQMVRPRDRTWMRLCAHLDQLTGRRFVIDAVALERDGVSLGHDAGLREDGELGELYGLTHASRLNLLRSASGLVLTTQSEARNLVNSKRSGLRGLRRGARLTDAIDQAMLQGRDASGRFVLLSHWEQTADHTIGIAAAVPPAPLSPGSAWRFESLSHPRELSVHIVNDRAVANGAVSASMVALVLAFIRRTRPRQVIFTFLGILAASGFFLTLTVPEPLAPPFAVLSFGFVILALAWARLPSSGNGMARGRSGGQTRTRVQSGAVIGLALMLFTVYRTNAESDQASDGGDARPLVVIIPFDPASPETRQQAPRVLLPRATYDWINKRAQSTDALAEQVLVRSTVMTGRMELDRLELTIDLDLQVLADENARILVPLHGLVVRSAALGDTPCPIEPGPGGVFVSIPDRGSHRLRLNTVLALDATAVQGMLDVSVPPAPRCTLLLEVPTDVSLEVESAMDASTRRDMDHHQIRAELGGASRFVARWSRQIDPVPRMRSDLASMVSWRGGAISVELRANVQVESGSTRRLVLETDPQFVWQQVKAAGLSGYWQHGTGTSSQCILQFDRPIDKTVSVTVTGFLQNLTGDRVLVPMFRILDSQLGMRLLALQTVESTKLRIVEPGNLRKSTPEDFEVVWGESPPQPLESVVVPLDATGVVIERIRSAARPTLQMRAELRATRSRTDVHTEIVSDSQAPGGPYELLVPADMVVSTVRTSSGTHWRSLDSNRILWWGTGLALGDAVPSMEISGWLPRNAAAEPLPLIRPARDVGVMGEVTVWRARDLSVTWDEVRGFKEVPIPPESAVPSPALVVESRWAIESPDFAAIWTAEPRDPSIAATVATRVLVEADGAEWTAVIDCQVSDGALRELAWHVPIALAEPIQLSAEGILERETSWLPNGGQSWRVTLDGPRWSSYRLVLRGRLVRGADGRFVVPIVAPQDLTSVNQFMLILNSSDQHLSIPDIRGSESVPYETFGKWFSEPITKNVVGAARLHNPPELVAIQADRSAPDAVGPMIALERHRAWLSARDTVWVESTILVRARTAGELQLRIPAAAIVREAIVNGYKSAPLATESGRCAIFLGGEERLHELVVLWSWPLHDRGKSTAYDLEFPRLGDSECSVIWKLFVPPNSRIRSTAVPTSLSLVYVTEAQAIAEQLSYWAALPRATEEGERANVLRELEYALIAAADRARRCLEVEADQGLQGYRLQKDHDRAAELLNRLLESNRRLLEQTELRGLRMRTNLPSGRFATDQRLLFPSQEASADTFPVTADLPPNGKMYLYVTGRPRLRLSIEEAATSVAASRPMVASLAAAMTGALVCWLVGRERRPRWLWPLLVGAVGLLWTWKLQPEPVGPALLFVAAILLFVGAVQRMIRTDPQVVSAPGGQRVSSVN